MIRVGFGQADITPPLGTRCAMGIDDDALEILDPVRVRATVLGQGETAIGLLSVDVIGLYRPEIQELRELISGATGLMPERIILHTTHTHESPNAEVSWAEIVKEWGLPWHTPEFYDLLRSQAVHACELALADAHDATVSFGLWPVAGVASNRRISPLNGPTVLRESRSNAVYRLYPEGWIDPYLRLIVFGDPTSGAEHWLLNYACHPTAAGGDEGPYITADFPGNAMARIEQELSNVTCNYFTGCCGNINPGKHTGSGYEPAARVADIVRMGGLLADAARQARKHTHAVDVRAMSWRRLDVGLPLLPAIQDRPALEREVERQALAYSERRAAGHLEAGGGPLRPALDRLQANRLSTDGMLPTEVGAIGMGDLAILFLPGECFLELDAALRQRFPCKKLVVAELWDATPGYILTPDAFPQGGYEASVALCDPSSFQRLVDAGAAALAAVWQNQGE